MTKAAAFCVECGAVLAPDAIRCSVCGTPAPAVSSVPSWVTNSAGPAEPVIAQRTAFVAESAGVAGPVGAAAPTPSSTPALESAAGAGPAGAPRVFNPPPRPLAAPARVEFAGIGRRFAALVIDAIVPAVVLYALIVLGLATAGVGGALTGYLLGAGFSLVYGVLLWAMLAIRGDSPGKAALGLRVIRAVNGQSPGWGPALLRLLVRGVLISITLGIAGLSPLWDPSGRRRAWWDRVVDTLVVVRLRLPAVPAANGQTPIPPPVVAPFTATFARPTNVPGTPPFAGPFTETRMSPFAPSGTSPRGPAETPFVPASGTPPFAAPVPAAPPFAAPLPAAPPFTATVPAVASFAAPAPAAAATGSALVPGWGSAGHPGPVDGSDPEATLDPWVGDKVDSWAFSDSAGAAGPGSPRVEPETPTPPSPLESTTVSPRHRASTGPQLVLDTGERIPAGAVVLIGRDPAISSTDGPVQLVPLTDDTRSVSKTHLKLEIHDGQVLLTDRHSTNGSAYQDRGGALVSCPAGVTIEVPEGATIIFGDRHLTIDGVS